MIYDYIPFVFHFPWISRKIENDFDDLLAARKLQMQRGKITVYWKRVIHSSELSKRTDCVSQNATQRC